MSSLNNDHLTLKLGDVTELVSTRNILSVENNCTGGLEIKYAITKGHEWMVEERTVASTSFQQDIVDVFKKIKETQTWRPKRLKVFINPSSGSNNGRKTYFDEVEPIFKMANINTDAIVTASGSEARETLMSADLTEIDGVISVGGDGTFWTVASGLLERAQIDDEIDLDNPEQLPAEPKIRLGAIPGGSYCAIALDAVGIHSPITSAIQIALGYSHRRDAMSVSNADGNKFIGFFTVLLQFIVGQERTNMVCTRLRPIFGPTRMIFREIIRRVLYTDEKIQYHARMTKRGCFRNCSTCAVDKASGSNHEDKMITRSDISNALLLFKGKIINQSAPGGMFPCAHLSDGTADLSCFPFVPFWKVFFGIFFVIMFNKENVFQAQIIHSSSFRQEGIRMIELDFSESKVVPDLLLDDEKPYRLTNPQVKRVNVRVHRRLLTVFGAGIDETASPWEGQPGSFDVPYVRKFVLFSLLVGLLFIIYALLM